MTLKELARLVETTREAQRQYFANRSNTNLIFAKHCEKKLDRAAADILSTPTLFEEQEGQVPR